MKIEIDTKEDVHILRHVINLLHAVSASAGGKKFDYDSTSSMFSEPSTAQSSSVPETPAGIFNMFDTPSTPSDSSSSSSYPSPFPIEEIKKDDKKDFIDSLQVY